MFPGNAEITSESIAYYFYNENLGTPSNPRSIGYLLKSTDGWNTWNLIYSTGDPYSSGWIFQMNFMNDTVGYMKVGASGFGGIIQTINGGLSWGNYIQGNDETMCYSFPKINFGYIDKRWGFLELYDHGNWSVQCTLSQFPAYKTFKFINDSVGFMFYKDTSPNLGRTDNYGVLWDILNQGLGIVNLLDFLDNLNGYCCNSDNQLFVSHDQGANWNPLDSLPFPEINVLDFLNKDTGWVAGKQGKIFKTINGGFTWDEIPSWNSDEIIKLRFFTDSSGYYLSKRKIGGLYYYYLYKTVIGPWGIEEQKLPNIIKITPNPVNSFLTLSLKNSQRKIELLEIYSITGERMFHSSRFIEKIDVSGYKNGVYILCYRINGRNYPIRFIVLN